jgi:tRNA U38,U39,U40 pseudouridine synthase TruA
MENSFENRKFNIPNAPSLGLYLERTLFSYYKQKLEKSTVELKDIDFNQYEVIYIIKYNLHILNVSRVN